MKDKIIIYDFDGVICDSVNIKTEAFSFMYNRYGYNILKAVIDYHIENGGISRYDKIRYFESELLNRQISDADIEILASEFSFLVKQKVINSNYINGVIPFLKKNSSNYLQYICTGTPEIEILEILNERNLTNQFDGVYGSPKSKADIINNILLETAIDKGRVIFFGDALTDYKAAKECGISFVGIKNKETKFPPNTFLINDFEDEDILKMF